MCICIYKIRDQITDIKNLCKWTISEYHYTYDNRGFIVGENVTESLYDNGGKLIRETEKEDRQGTYVYDYEYEEAGNYTFTKKAKTFPYIYLDSWQNTCTYNDDN